MSLRTSDVPTEPAYFQHQFKILECATDRGVPMSVVTFSRGVGMDEIATDALEALAALLERERDLHPGLSMSTDPNDWDLQLIDVAQPLPWNIPGVEDFPIKLLLIWNLGLKERSLTQEVAA